jgi:hypothetical protein
MIYYYKTYIFKFEFFYSQMLIAEKNPTPHVFSASQHSPPFNTLYRVKMHPFGMAILALLMMMLFSMGNSMMADGGGSNQQALTAFVPFRLTRRKQRTMRMDGLFPHLVLATRMLQIRPAVQIQPTGGASSAKPEGEAHIGDGCWTYQCR